MRSRKKQVFFNSKKPRSEELEVILGKIGDEIEETLRKDKITSADLIITLEYDEENNYLKSKMDVTITKRTSGYFGPEEEAARIIEKARKSLEESLDEIYVEKNDTKTPEERR